MKFKVLMFILYAYWITLLIYMLLVDTTIVKTDTKIVTSFKNDNFVYTELNKIRMESGSNTKFERFVNLFIPKLFQTIKISVHSYPSIITRNNTSNDEKLSKETVNVKNSEFDMKYNEFDMNNNESNSKNSEFNSKNSEFNSKNNEFNVKNLEIDMKNDVFNASLSKSLDQSEDIVDEHSVYSLGLKMIKGKFVLNGDVVRIMSTRFEYSNRTSDEWKRSLLLMKKHGLNTVTLCVDSNLTQNGIQSLRKVLTLVHEDFLFAILEIKLYTRCLEDFSSDDRFPQEVTSSQIDALLEKLIPAIEEFQVTRGGLIIALLFSDVTKYSGNSDYINLFQYIVQRLRFYGIQELVLKTEAPQNLSTYPFSNIALPILKLDHIMVPRSKLLFEIKRLNNDFPLMIITSIANVSTINVIVNTSSNILASFILNDIPKALN